MVLTDIRKTAFMAAVTLTLVRLHWIVGQIQLMVALQTLQWVVVARLMGNLLFVLPLPILLWILYATNTTPIVSRGLRYVALATACVEGLLLAVPRLYRLAQGVQRLPGLRGFSGATEAGQLWGWVQNPWIGTLFLSALILVSQVALILFLMALFLQGQLPEITYGHARQLARRVAAVAVFMGVLAAILRISQLVYAIIMASARPDQIRWIGTEARNQFILHGALSQLSNLCWVMVAWIAYKGLAQTSAEEPKSFS